MSNTKHIAVNNSTSKQLYSFSKSDRFPNHKSLNNKVAYETKSDFNKAGEGGNGRPFFHTSTRFSYYASPQKQGKLPSPSLYKIKDTFGTSAPKTNESYSFGVGRDDMKRLFIEDIKKKGDNNLPGPGRYTAEKNFGSEGLDYSMAKRLGQDERALDKSKKLPGPGYYQHPQITGMAITQSHIKTESKFAFGKANDRFNVPTRKVPAPAPNVYQPKNNLNENFNSTFNQAQQTKIGNNNSSILDQHFKLQIKSPGPGQYSRFSDFGGLN